MSETDKSSDLLAHGGLILMCLILAGISVLCSFLNPLGFLFTGLTRPLVAITGGTVPLGWGQYGSLVTVNLAWPSSLMPVYWFGSIRLKWGFWRCLLVWLGVNLLIAFLAQRFDMGIH